MANETRPRHKLAETRVRRGFTREKLAEKIGVEPKSVQRWESGVVQPHPEHLQKLCELLKATPEELDLGLTSADENDIDTHIQKVLRDHALVDHEKLFGVDDFIAEVGTTLGISSGAWVISLFGEGGVGKTTLAYEIVSRYASSAGYTRIAWISAKNLYISTDGMDLSNRSTDIRWAEIIEKAASQLSIKLGYASSSWIRDFQEKIRALPSEEKCLIIIDNLETVKNTDDAIRYLCGDQIVKPHKILVTTRHSLSTAARRILPATAPAVVERRMTGLEPQAALDFIRSFRDLDIRQASDEDLQPILEATERNPLLIKLLMRRFIDTGLPLKFVLEELRFVKERMGKNIVDYLYSRSLSVLEERCGKDVATKIILAFCPISPGDMANYEELHRFSGISDAEIFKRALQEAYNLALIRGSKLNSKYSIHSLLRKYICNPDD